VSFTASDLPVVNTFLHEANMMKYLSQLIEQLLSVSMLISDDFHAECILDSGCQVAVIKKDVWQHSRLPLNAKSNITMESVNTNKDTMLGLVTTKMSLGDIACMIPCQVVDKASFEILLG
jgi:hypothetical protein